MRLIFFVVRINEQFTATQSVITLHWSMYFSLTIYSDKLRAIRDKYSRVFIDRRQVLLRTCRIGDRTQVKQAKLYASIGRFTFHRVSV